MNTIWNCRKELIVMVKIIDFTQSCCPNNNRSVDVMRGHVFGLAKTTLLFANFNTDHINGNALDNRSSSITYIYDVKIVSELGRDVFESVPGTDSSFVQSLMLLMFTLLDLQVTPST
jgi:hypothetical protein